MSLRDFALMVVVCLTWAANNILSKYDVSDLQIPPLLYASARFAVLALA
jgi:O-acetylserine/cysteine efflux transporter